MYMNHNPSKYDDVICEQPLTSLFSSPEGDFLELLFLFLAPLRNP